MILLLILLVSIAQGKRQALDCLPSEAFIETFLHDAHIPGMAIVAVNATHILYEQGFGYKTPLLANEDRQPIDSSKTIFVLASISKTFIAVAVMQLVELHKLDLDHDVNQYLSYPMKITHPLYPNIPITMRHILSHTSGIGPNFDEEMKFYLPNDDFIKTNLSNVISVYVNNKLNWLPEPPGSFTHYSNIGASLAALVVEQITQIPFEEYVHAKILQPLGISRKEAGYRLSDFEHRKQDLAEHYIFNSSLYEDMRQLLPQLNVTRVDNLSDWFYISHFSVNLYPAGLLRMSAHTLAVYLQSFLNNFASILLDPSSVNEMIEVNVDRSKETQFSLIWTWTNWHGRRFVGHRGVMPAVANAMMANEDRTLGVIALSNGDVINSNAVAQHIEQTMMKIMTQLFDCFQ